MASINHWAQIQNGKENRKRMPGFPAHQGAFFSAVENTSLLKQERNKGDGQNC